MFHSTRSASNLEMANSLPQIFLACTVSLTTPVLLPWYYHPNQVLYKLDAEMLVLPHLWDLHVQTFCVTEPSVTPLSHIVPTLCKVGLLPGIPISVMYCTWT